MVGLWAGCLLSLILSAQQPPWQDGERRTGWGGGRPGAAPAQKTAGSNVGHGAGAPAERGQDVVGCPRKSRKILARDPTDVEPPAQHLLACAVPDDRQPRARPRSTGRVAGSGSSHGGAGRVEATRSQAQLFPIIFEGPGA